VQDVRRTVDYLESRPDIDRNRLAFLGYSYGAVLAPTVLTSEERLKAGIVVLGSLCGCLPGTVRPEIDTQVYAPRVKTPILMLNGKYDLTEPLETTVKPMFDLLGTPKENKKLVVYDTDHFVPRNEFMKETLAWLDRYLGPVK
jgi:dipeptidyl aminopeptidase/acylaminoacyl peptidase